MPPAEILKAHSTSDRPEVQRASRRDSESALVAFSLRTGLRERSSVPPLRTGLRSSVPPAEILKAHFNSGDFTQFLIWCHFGVRRS